MENKLNYKSNDFDDFCVVFTHEGVYTVHIYKQKEIMMLKILFYLIDHDYFYFKI